MRPRPPSSRVVHLLALLATLVVGLLGIALVWAPLPPQLAALEGLLALAALGIMLRLLREFGRQAAAQAALAANEARLRDFASSADWLWETDSEHRFIWFDEKIRDARFSKEAALGRTRLELGRQDEDQTKWAAHRADLEARREFRNFQYSQPDRTGRMRHVRISGRPVFDAEGTFLGYRGTALDVTGEIEARAEADRAGTRLSDAISSIAESFALFDADDRLIVCNQQYADRNRMAAQDLKGWTFAEILRMTIQNHRIDPAMFGGAPEEWVQRRLEQHRNPGRPIEIKYQDGSWQRIVENRTRDGGIVHVSADITELKNREAELHARVSQQNSVALLAQLALDPVDLDRLLAKATDLVTRTLGVPVSSVFELSGDGRELVMRASTGWSREHIGNTRLPADERRLGGYTLKSRTPVFTDDLPNETRFDVHPKIRARGYKSAFATTIGGGAQPFGVITCAGTRRNPFSAGEINFLQAVANVLASAIQIRQQEARLRAILDNSVDAILSFDEQGRVHSANQAVERMFGYREGEIADRPITLLLSGKHRARFAAEIRGHIDRGQSQFVGELHEVDGVRRDGAEFPVDVGVRELRLGRRRIFIATIHDATDRKATEQHLRHAQKMEAIGQLTGGIAHDFNNLLTIILGNAEMLLDTLPAAAPARAQANSVISAANSGAQLTQRLLAFARQQTLAAVAFDANALVLRTAGLLRRTLGEHIVIRHQLAPDLPLVFADASQLENALVNLAVNGRDAMPKGGVLTIETALVHLDDAPAALTAGAGEYVMLSVTDTGTGMTPEVLGRVFEPFFTTKEVGKGTGLGLSMVYGFITQSHGHVRIDSEIGRGTTVKLYLPLAPSGVEEASLPAESSQVPRGSATILLVEDNAEVRRLASARLESLGYSIIEAADGPSALVIIESEQPLDLLFSDVAMPGGIDGRQLASLARARRPDLRILLASGYAEAATADVMDEPFEIVTKPYSKQVLAQRVYEALTRAR
jgi:PAS domain S-box-containing protein